MPKNVFTIQLQLKMPDLQGCLTLPSLIGAGVRILS